MPLRPAPNTWVLPAFDPAVVVEVARAVVGRYGFAVATTGGGELRELRVDGDAVAVEAAAARFDSCRDEIEPPCDGERYRLVVRLLEPDEDDPRARIEVLPYDDNWAAWSVAGPLAEELAVALGGLEITGDPPLWIQSELAASEQPTPARLPFLAVRAPSLFPGFATTTTFGREASVRSIEGLLALEQARIVIAVQRDPFRAHLPDNIADVQPVALDARILRAIRQDDSFILVLKGIARVYVRALDLASEVPSMLVDPVPLGGSAGGFITLRSFASSDPLVRDAAGVSLLAKLKELDVGALADLVASASNDANLMTRALLEVDPSRRAQLVTAAIG